MASNIGKLKLTLKQIKIYSIHLLNWTRKDKNQILIYRMLLIMISTLKRKILRIRINKNGSRLARKNLKELWQVKGLPLTDGNELHFNSITQYFAFC